MRQRPKPRGRRASVPGIRPAPLYAQNRPAGPGRDLNSADDEGVVAIVTVAAALFVPPSVSEGGEIVHSAPGGTPAQDKVTLWLKPPCGISVNLNMADPPAVTVTLPGDPNNAKPWPPGETTVTVVEPQTSPVQALTVEDPTPTPKTTPLLVESFVMPLLLPESFVTVTTVLSEVLQIAEGSVCVLLSLNVPVAARLREVPMVNVGLAGPILIDIKFDGAKAPGWYNSAFLKAGLPAFQPPATRTVPSVSRVAVWTWRAVSKLPVTLKFPVAGS